MILTGENSYSGGSRSIRNWFKEIYEVVKSVNPNAIVMQNYYPYDSHDTDVLAKYQDVLSIEAFYEWGSIWKPGEKAMLGRAVGEEKIPVWIILHDSHMWGQIGAAPMVRPEVEMRLVCADTVAHGGMPQLWAHNYIPVRPNAKRGGVGIAKAVFDDLDKIKDYIVNVKSMKHAAVLFSKQSIIFHGMALASKLKMVEPTKEEMVGRPIWQRILLGMSMVLSAMTYNVGHIYGFYKALLENHVPMDYVVDKELTEQYLSQYKVLVLPNAACLSEKQNQAIRNYVANGGGLVATYMTSLKDEEGVMRKDFGLADVFHASYKGSTENQGDWR